MDLIYTNSARVDQGVLQDYELDLAFGADENNLECKVQAGSHCCESGSLLYMEGTEYGGIIDSIESDTDSKEVIYTGRTWHGILNSKVLQPDSGAAYLTVSGEANSVIASLLTRMGLTDLFEASSEDSGLNISNYKMNRYISGYDGILKMLKTVGGKLKLSFSNGKVVLSAAAVHDYTQDEEFDADQVPFRAKRNYKGVNHLICLGSGQLEERMVVHLYADTDGNISQEQTQFDLDEVCTIFEYSNIETEEELIQEGKERFESLMAEDEISIDFDADSDTYDVGDIIGAVDNITGLSAYTTIAKKIVTIKNGKITISLTPDKAKEGSSFEGSGSGGGGESVDAYTKAETLSSEVKTMLGLEADATPSDAFKALKTIMFCPQIVVTAPTGSTVTCRKGDIILTAEEVDGTWTFNVTEYGEWTIVANDGTKAVLVDAVKRYAVNFEYVILEYIESTGTQYIDTEYAFATNNGRIVVDFMPLAIETTYRFCGAYDGSNRSLVIDPRTNKFVFGIGNNDYYYSSMAANVRYQVDLSASGTTAKYNISNGASGSFTYGGTIVTNLNCFIFANDNKGSATNHVKMRCWGHQIYEAENLVRNHAPAKRLSDGAVGMYDRVNGVFRENAGSGTFTAGAETGEYI